MSDGRAVRNAIDALRGAPPHRDRAPEDARGLLEYWQDRGGTRGLAEALGRGPVKRPRDGATQKTGRGPEWTAYRAYRAQSRDIQRWRHAAGLGTGQARHLRGAELGRVRDITQERMDRDAPRAPGRPSRAQVLAGLKERGAVVDFAGFVTISEDEWTYRSYVAHIPPGDPIGRFVAEGLLGHWEDASDELADAWRLYLDVGAIPVYLTWEQADTLIIDYWGPPAGPSRRRRK